MQISVPIDDNITSFVLDFVCFAVGAFQNARKYYDHKKQSAVKERKTIEASEKALKSAEIKTQELLKQVQLKSNISKSRKTYWFEKFLWFISSDNYLVIGGRDAQQNELIVKRYLKFGDAYVHADIRGAASVVIKNRVPSEPIPPRTLSEAGTMAVCYSAAWEAKVVTSAWWVSSDQVTKTAPSGEYLTTGSFMIRGKKNFLPPCQLIMGFGVLFKLDDECIPIHVEARRAQQMNREDSKTTLDSEEISTVDSQIELDSSSDEETQTDTTKMSNTKGKMEEDEVEGEIFPDVAVRLKHLSVNAVEDKDEEVSILQIGPAHAPVKKKFVENVKDKKGKNAKVTKIPEVQEDENKTKSSQPKRGQKGKQKKIKGKYKDQDEEERQMRLKLLGSTSVRPQTNQSSDVKNKASLNEPIFDDQKSSKMHSDTTNKEANADDNEIEDVADLDDVQIPCETAPEVEQEQVEETNEDQDDLNKLTDEALSALDALTGTPFLDDIMIFAVPTCAPYTALNNFKFKVKLTPGTGKKGKATKMALQVFLKDRTLSPREKDLIKLLNDQDLSRNIPGKVKVSAPQLQVVKRKH